VRYYWIKVTVHGLSFSFSKEENVQQLALKAKNKALPHVLNGNAFVLDTITVYCGMYVK